MPAVFLPVVSSIGGSNLWNGALSTGCSEAVLEDAGAEDSPLPVGCESLFALPLLHALTNTTESASSSDIILIFRALDCIGVPLFKYQPLVVA